MPRSASAVGLAKRGVIPRKQFYIKLLFINTVILVSVHRRQRFLDILHLPLVRRREGGIVLHLPPCRQALFQPESRQPEILPLLRRAFMPAARELRIHQAHGRPPLRREKPLRRR